MIGSEPYKSGIANKLKGILSNSTKIRASEIRAATRVVAAPPSSTALIRNIKLPPAKVLKKKWGKFERHNSLYEDSVAAFSYLGRAVNSRDFTTSTNAYYDDKNNLGPRTQKALLDKNPDFYHMAITDKYIETKVTLPDLEARINLAGDPQSLMDAENILQVIFGSGYKTPKEWSRVVDEGATTSFNTNKASVGQDVTVTIPIEKIATLKLKYRSHNDDIKKINAEKFQLEESHWKNNFKDIASIRLTLVQSDVSLGGNVTRGQSNGSLVNSVYPVYIPIRAELLMRWPLEFAMYATCCEKADDFIPFIFYQYLTWHRVAYGGGRGRGGGFAANPPSRISNFGNIVKRNDKEKAKGRNPKVRVNEDGFTILGVGQPSQTGEVVWIPDNINKVSEYLDQIKKAYNPTESRMELYNVKLKGEGLFTDPFNDKFTYFRETGTTGRGAADISGVQTIDLTGSTKLDRITIYNRITRDLRGVEGNKEHDVFVNFLSLIKKFVEGDNKDAKPSRNYASRDYLEACGLPKGYEYRGTMTDFIKEQVGRNIEPVTWANLGGYPLDNVVNGEIVSESNKEDAKYFVLIRAACNVVKGIAEDMLAQFDKLSVGYVNKLEGLRFQLFLVTKYSALMNADPLHPEKLGLVKQFASVTSTNSTAPISNAQFDDISKSILAPNMPNLKAMMPHQLETAHYTKDSPEATLIEISAGGGKTPTSMREICQMLYEKKIKRPLVVAPGNLVRNWANEVAFFSNGKMNAFVLTIQSLRRLQYVYSKNPDPTQKPDYEMLKKILDSLPPNTIILTSYNFLGVDRENIVYGNETVTRLYAAEFLRDLPCDLVAVDESHYAKNLKSNRTLGVSIVESAAKFKRGLSGTTVNDSLDDLIGQAGTMVPAALGSESNFNSKYLTSAGAMKANAPVLITQDMKPYIQRIVHKRQKWAAFLPRVSEQFHPVNMTPRQQEFYNALLSEALEDLKRKNPKLAAKMIDGGDESENENSAIERGLGIHFQSVEQFIYAPDSNPAFLALEDLEPNDLVSPKIAVLEDLLRNHFKGYTDSSGVKVPADDNKVIIFSHRTKTSEHVMKHIAPEFQKIAVRYVAGDFKALQAFLKNPKIKIIIADEISINTGQNFQIASRMIRLETLWSPGDQEQALARIWRPDFKTNNTRKRIFLDWIFSNNSLEVCKIGRLISKIVTKMKYDQQDNPYFTKEIFKPSAKFIESRRQYIPQITNRISVDDMLSGSTLKLVKMSTKNMLQFNQTEQLKDYFSIYALANHWEDSEFERLAKDPRYAKVITLPPEAYVEIEGSKELPYYPRIPGIEPAAFDPLNKMGYKPISVVETENALNSDDDDESEQEVNAVSINDLVDTEFGIGKVSKILDKEIWVDIRGLGEVKVPKSTAWLITDEDALEEVRNALAKAGKKGIVRLPTPISNTLKVSETPVKPVTQINEDDDEDEDEDESDTPQRKSTVKYDEYDNEDEDEDNELNIFAELVDGQVALTTSTDDDDSKSLLEEYDFKVMESYVLFSVPNVAAFDGLMKVLTGKFKILDKYVANLQFYRKYIQAKSLNTVTTANLKDTLRFFNVEMDKPIGEDYMRPFPVVWGGKFYIAFNRKKHMGANLIIRTVKAASLSGVKSQQQDHTCIKFYKTAEDAIDELGLIAKILSIPNISDTVTFLKSVKKKAPEKKPLFNLNRKLEEDEDEEEDDNKPTPTRKPIFQLTKPKAEIAKPTVKKTVKAPPPPPAPVPSKPATPVKKPSFVFNLGRGKVK